MSTKTIYPRDSYQANSSEEADEAKQHKLSDHRIAIIGLVISLSIIIGKLLSTWKDDIYNIVFERQLITYEVVTEKGEVMMKHAWTITIRYSNLWLPVLCGALATYFTWCVVYLDSSEPGVQPPSPFSPTKYKKQSGHTFHLNYVFAVLIGLFIASYMMWRGISLE